MSRTEYAADREPETGTGDPTFGRVEPIERHEHPVGTRRLDTPSLILDLDAHMGINLADGNGDCAGGRTELDRIGQEVDEHLTETIFVGTHEEPGARARRRVARQPVGVRDGLDQRHGSVHYRIDADRFEVGTSRHRVATHGLEHRRR